MRAVDGAGDGAVLVRALEGLGHRPRAGGRLHFAGLFNATRDLFRRDQRPGAVMHRDDLRLRGKSAFKPSCTER